MAAVRVAVVGVVAYRQPAYWTGVVDVGPVGKMGEVGVVLCCSHPGHVSLCCYRNSYLGQSGHVLASVVVVVYPYVHFVCPHLSVFCCRS